MLQKIIPAIRKRAAKYILQGITESEFSSQVSAPNERTVEYDFVLQSLLKTNPRTVLDVGSGTSSLPHMLHICGFHVTAVDNISDYWTGSVFNRHFHVMDENILSPRIEKKFDFITCISVLEHIQDHAKAVRSMMSMLRPGGHLAMTFPYNEQKFVENVYALPEATFGKNVPYICHVFSRKEVDCWLKEGDGTLADMRFYRLFTGELHTFGEAIFPPEAATADKPHQLGCVLIRKN